MGMDWKKAAATAVIGASTIFGGMQNAKAEIDYEGIKYLGGGDKVDSITLTSARFRSSPVCIPPSLARW